MKSIYFASDFHLGSPPGKPSRERELRIVRWLDSIQDDARELYLMGDLFDFWFEYRHVVPKGYTRLLGKMAEISDAGIPIHVFPGNHDMWMKGYLEDEMGAHIYFEPQRREIDGKLFYFAHGDGLGPGDQGYKFLKKVFTNRLAQWLFRILHPDAGIGLANYFSRLSRSHTGEKDAVFLGEEKEWLIQHSKKLLETEKIDYFIYGHRHLPLLLPLEKGATYVNLGDWIKYCSYGVWDGKEIRLLYVEGC